MIKNYLTIAIRTMLRNSLFTLINVGGLAIGLSSCLFVAFYVYDELTYDHFHENADRVYRVTSNFNNSNRVRFTDQKIGPYLKRVTPEVQEFTRFDTYHAKFQKGNDWFSEDGIFATDHSVFDVFTYPLVAGDPTKVFSKGKKSIVLSQSLAIKYAGNDPLGKTVVIDKNPYEITGVMEDVPHNSDKWVNGFVFGDFPGEESKDLKVGFDTYLLFNKEIRPEEVKVLLDQAAVNLWGQEGGIQYEAQPLLDLHFTYGIQMDNPKGNKENVYIFLLVAGILILVVVFNFINLSTVKSLERAKEVGIRKVIGARPSQLTRQFLGESLLITFIALLIASIIIIVSHPFFYVLTGKSISFTSTQTVLVLIVLLVTLSVITLIPSLYPAMTLSAFKPVSVLKGKYSYVASKNIVRKFFIVGQFALSAGLLSFLMVVILQTNKFKRTDLGFNPQDVVVTWLPSNMKNEILKLEGVSEVATAEFGSIPGEDARSTSIWFTEFGNQQQLQVQGISGDEDYMDLLKLEITKGQPVKSFVESQWNNLAWINETLAHQLGWDDPIDKELEIPLFDGGNERRKITIAGVIRDFHFKSLHNAIDPLIYFPAKGDKHLFARITPGDLTDFKNSWKKNLPDHEFGYLLSEGFENQYKAEETLLMLLVFFTLLTIILATLGLYGLTAYVVQTRTKEVGIRKVMGAQVNSIVSLLSKDFINLILMGSVVGSFVAYLSSEDWLKRFAYKVEIAWWYWAIPLLLIASFSILLIAFRTYRVAKVNPTDSLRYE